MHTHRGVRQRPPGCVQDLTLHVVESACDAVLCSEVQGTPKEKWPQHRLLELHVVELATATCVQQYLFAHTQGVRQRPPGCVQDSDTACC